MGDLLTSVNSNIVDIRLRLSCKCKGSTLAPPGIAWPSLRLMRNLYGYGIRVQVLAAVVLRFRVEG